MQAAALDRVQICIVKIAIIDGIHKADTVVNTLILLILVLARQLNSKTSFQDELRWSWGLTTGDKHIQARQIELVTAHSSLRIEASTSRKVQLARCWDRFEGIDAWNTEIQTSSKGT